MTKAPVLQKLFAQVRRIFGTAGWLIVIVAAGALLIPSLLGFQRYVIVSGSMTGTYDKGSIVFEKAKASNTLAVGDVITYRPPASTGVTNLVTHRLYKITAGENGQRIYRTKGDANQGPDPWTFTLPTATQNVAKFSIPYLGHVLIALADAHTRLIVIGVPAAIIALLALYDLVTESLLPRRVGTVT
jgi:signal peptidase